MQARKVTALLLRRVIGTLRDWTAEPPQLGVAERLYRPEDDSVEGRLHWQNPNERDFRMTLDSEDAVKKALGIDSFRELSKEKMLAFAAAMPEMTSAVRMNLIEQIPGFQKFALDAVSAVERTFEQTLESNDKNQRDVHQALGEVRSILKGELDRDDISEDHRKFLVEQLMETGNIEFRKDTENKKFQGEQADGTRKSTVLVTGIVVVAAVILAGGKVIVGRGGVQV